LRGLKSAASAVSTGASAQSEEKDNVAASIAF